jgi:hypothetical protein
MLKASHVLVMQLRLSLILNEIAGYYAIATLTVTWFLPYPLPYPLTEIVT